MFDFGMFTDAFDVLTNNPWDALVGMFWFTLLFEIPRYAMGFGGTLAMIYKDRVDPPYPHLPNDLGRVSILIAGHNEADAIERGVRSIREQSFNNFEIVCVSDGSTDETFDIMKRLQREGLVDKVAGCQIRGGKSSAINLAARLASGDILIVIDCDCTFDRDAIEEILKPFSNPEVGAVSGNVLVKNGDHSVVAALQTIEYMITITLGKALMDMFGQVAIISGAFGAFRRSAWQRVNGMDPGPGEDFDITLRLRHAGYKIVFAHRSVCYTDVPIALFNLMRQRNRWERDAFWIRFRKFGRTINPFRYDFDWREVIHQVDFLYFNIIASIIFPFYLVITLSIWGGIGVIYIMAVTFGLMFIEFGVFACAVLATGKPAYWRFAPYMLIYGLFQSYYMRFVRLYAYMDEWIYSTSRNDSFAPPKVNAWIRWK